MTHCIEHVPNRLSLWKASIVIKLYLFIYDVVRYDELIVMEYFFPLNKNPTAKKAKKRVGPKKLKDLANLKDWKRDSLHRFRCIDKE